jgi:hypothetical protein
MIELEFAEFIAAKWPIFVKTKRQASFTYTSILSICRYASITLTYLRSLKLEKNMCCDERNIKDLLFACDGEKHFPEIRSPLEVWGNKSCLSSKIECVYIVFSCLQEKLEAILSGVQYNFAHD